jgi:homoserine kinase
MSNNKQSSVEWLYFAMEDFIHKSCRVHFVEYFEKAKAMHKEEIKDAQIDGSMNSTLVEYRIPHYYNETFGGNNEQQ